MKKGCDHFICCLMDAPFIQWRDGGAKFAPFITVEKLLCFLISRSLNMSSERMKNAGYLPKSFWLIIQLILYIC